jgi:hypothetical protein
MGLALIASTIERHEMRLHRLEGSISTLSRGLRIAAAVEHEQAFRRIVAMLIGMPTAVAGLLFCGVFYNGWQGNGVWYGVVCMSISAVTIRGALDQIETHHGDLQERLFDLVLQRQRVRGELEAAYEKKKNYRRVKNPIEVKGAA